MSTPVPQIVFTGDLRPYPGRPGINPAREAAFLESARRLFPDFREEVVDGADFEDFWEDAARAHAAYQAVGDELFVASHVRSMARRVGDGAVAGPTDHWLSEGVNVIRLGPVTNAELGSHHPQMLKGELELLREYGGRTVEIVGLDSTKDEDGVTAFLSHTPAAVFKRLDAKQSPLAVDARTAHTPHERRERYEEALEQAGYYWDAVHLDGRGRAYLAQGRVRMGFEYRLFVVDGEIVTGAGCVEEYTPLHAPEFGRFDDRVRERRGYLGEAATPEVVHKPAIVSDLIEFGSRICQNPLMRGRDLVLDVALNLERGTPVLVECNELSNAGLYASDIVAVYRSICERAHR